jgi:acyl-CoA synthetase (AMP-forming)/AMP-acid ligase II
LGEIESVLYRHPEVEEAAVLAIPDEQMGNLIKAVVVVRGVDALTSRQLEAFCAEHLPKYMIPGSIEVRAYLPKTSTGKIDKTQLLNVHLETRSA